MNKAWKWIALIIVVLLLLQQISLRRAEALYFVPVILLILSLVLIKRWFPAIFRIMKGITFWSAKTMAAILWQKSERKGGASVRSQKMRWRE